MPKETSIGRQNAHRPLTSQAYSNTPPASAFRHQYNHLPRPPGSYSFFPAGYDANVVSAYDQANIVKGLEFAAMVSAANAYVHKAPNVYDRRPPSPPQSGHNAHQVAQIAQVSQQHQAFERNSVHVMAPQFNSNDPKLAQYITNVQTYDRFSKKKLASHGPDKSGPVYLRNEPSRSQASTRQTLAREKSPLKATTSSANSSRITSSATTSTRVTSLPMTSEDKYRHERYKYDSPRGDYYRRSGVRRVGERQESNFERGIYEPPPSSAYDRLGVPPPTVITSTAPTYDRSASAAMERLAVFDRAYAQAAYERRTYGAPFPSAVNTSSAYYASYSRSSGGQHNNEELLVESKDLHSNFPAKPRMSLLTSPEYLSSLSRRSQIGDEARSGQTSVIVPSPVRSQESTSPTKVNKLRGVNAETMQPLTIDTSMANSPKFGDEKPSIYQPTVEPISPTSPPGADGTDGPDDSAPTRGLAKEHLLLEISQVDRKINKIEHHLVNLKRKEVELKKKAIRTESNVSDDTTEAPLPKHFSVAHKVYSENRKKAKDAHSAFSFLGPPVELPLYNQPSDTSVFHENIIRHSYFKHVLIRFLARQRNDRASRDRLLTEEYSRKTEIWNRSVEKMECSPERKRRDAEHRELFEKTFPKIRKEREDRERFLRVGSRVKSDADLEEIMDNLHEQEMEMKKMRAYAAVPPLLLPLEARRCVYVNTNGRVEDFATVHKERSLVNIWTEPEKDIFREKYLQYPKNFGAIASFLERKSVSDCVQYYYLSKKTENYKRQLKKTGQRSRAGRNRNKTAPPVPEPSHAPASSAPAIAPRFKRDYKPDPTAAPAPLVAMATPPRTPSPAPQPPPLSPTALTLANDWASDDKESPLEPPKLPPLLQPLLLTTDGITKTEARCNARGDHVVVIDDSDDSNSGISYLKK